MVDEGRFYHVGLDIIVGEHEPLHAPLGGEVARVGMDEGMGNFGGYVILRHELGGVVFYSFYGHVQTPQVVKQGDSIVPGQVFARIGAGRDSGGWFTHTHLQIITQAAMEQKRYLQGYVTAADLAHIEDLFPSPYPLFRVYAKRKAEASG